MEGFIGRQKELAALEALYSAAGPQTCAVFGRRQVGKSTLLRVFAEQRRAIIFQSFQSSAYENLAQMTQDLSDFLGQPMPLFPSFAAVFAALAKICRQAKTLIVFDEYPYLVMTEPAIPSILQRFIDAELPGTETMLIICGSSVAMMRKSIDDHAEPLYGRIPNRLELHPMSLRDTLAFHPKMTDADIVRTYLTVGGVPRYHLDMHHATYQEGLRKCFIERNAILRNEAEHLIRAECSPYQEHTGLFASLAGGAVKQSEIAEKAGISRPLCKLYLDRLLSLNMVETRHPMLGAPKQPSYRIADNLIAFDYQILRRHVSLLEDLRLSDDKKSRLIAHDVDTFLGTRFEDVCRDYLLDSYDVREIGSWWGRIDQTDGEIDLVATVLDERMLTHTIIAECKFRSRPVGFTELKLLQERAAAVGGFTNGHLMMISAGGFTDELSAYAADRGIALVGLEHLLGRLPPQPLAALGLFDPAD